MRKLPIEYNLYDAVYGNDFPLEQYYIIMFDLLPSKLTNATTYDITVIDSFLNDGFSKISENLCTNRRLENSHQLLMINENKKMIIKLYCSVEKEKLYTIEFLYDIKNGSLEEQISLIDIKKYEKKKKKSNINLVRSDMGHMDTEQYDLYVPDMNLELNYGSGFLKIHEIIQTRLNKNNDKGIILLHGDPGTGKTSYIKYLTSLITDKDILFIPPSMAEMLSEPSIIPFLMEHRNSILIIEDAERVISDREINGSPAGVSNILNLTDGILGDCLNIQIVATFNMRREKIDKALLRKGRLIVEHKFEKLNVNDTNKLLKHLKKDFVSSEEMCLADIYNIDVELIKSNKKISKIGF
jgi:SpoVK/Ycf46/Vps4 family AAA+-type ATPase